MHIVYIFLRTAFDETNEKRINGEGKNVLLPVRRPASDGPRLLRRRGRLDGTSCQRQFLANKAYEIFPQPQRPKKKKNSIPPRLPPPPPPPLSLARSTLPRITSLSRRRPSTPEDRRSYAFIRHIYMEENIKCNKKIKAHACPRPPFNTCQSSLPIVAQSLPGPVNTLTFLSLGHCWHRIYGIRCRDENIWSCAHGSTLRPCRTYVYGFENKSNRISQSS